MAWLKRRRLSAASRGLCAVALGACATFSRGHAAAVNYPLVVNNRSDFEVVVYAVPSVGAAGIRLGNARAFATTSMNVPRNALQSTDILVVKIRSIGSARSVRSWLSPGTPLDSNTVAELDIRADANGNLSRSSLYTEIAALGRRP